MKYQKQLIDLRLREYKQQLFDANADAFFGELDRDDMK
jgi:hypothetical protein